MSSGLISHAVYILIGNLNISININHNLIQNYFSKKVKVFGFLKVTIKNVAEKSFTPFNKKMLSKNQELLYHIKRENLNNSINTTFLQVEIKNVNRTEVLSIE